MKRRKEQGCGSQLQISGRPLHGRCTDALYPERLPGSQGWDEARVTEGGKGGAVAVSGHSNDVSV